MLNDLRTPLSVLLQSRNIHINHPNCTTEMISAFLCFNNLGQPRLTKFYSDLDTGVRQTLISQIFDLVAARPASACNFLPLPPLLAPNSNDNSPDVPSQITYRHYATLYFILISTSTESPLALLDLIQVFVECLDNQFANVCELDLIFGFETLHAVLNEMIVGGVVVETSLAKIIEGVKATEGNAGRRKAVNARDSGSSIGRGSGFAGLGWSTGTGSSWR
jgi:AP-3 complex subunit sigma